MGSNCIIYLLSFTLFLRVLEGLTAPFSSCTSVEISNPSDYSDRVQITNVPSNGFGPTNTTTATFLNAQPDTSYYAYFTFQQFELSQADYMIEIMMMEASRAASFVNINFTGGASGGYIARMKVAFIIIPSACASQISGQILSYCFVDCSSTQTQPSGNIIPFTKAFMTPLGGGSYNAFAYFNSVYLQTTDYPINHFGQSLGITIINSTHYQLTFTNISPVTMKIKYAVVSVFVYQLPSPSLKMIISAGSIDEMNPSANVNTFFGLTAYSFVNGKINFGVNSVNNQLALTYGAQMAAIRVALITFNVRKCYGSTPYIDTVQSLCVDACLTRTYLLNNTINCLPCAYDCLSCSDNFTCLTCNSTDYRQYNSITKRCGPILNYYDPGTTVAARCIYPNCCGTSPIIFYQNSTCLNTCPKNYSYNPQNKSCGSCNPGYWPISNLCTNIVGCKAAFIINFTVACSICDYSASFALGNRTCYCPQGYLYSKESQTCKQVCGDGIHFQEKCDDGNQIEGDGCSSACTVQTHFRCISNSSYVPSKCLYVASNIKLSLSWANKTAGRNQGVFSFKASTQYAKLNHTKLFIAFNFTSWPSTTSLQIATRENEIRVYADYDQDLQGNMAQLSLQLNPDYIENVKIISTTFQMSSVGAKLVLVRYYPIITIISQAIQILSYVVIGVFLVSSLAYKMFGVQVIHSFFVIYFVCLQTANQTEPYMHFASFKSTNLGFMENRQTFFSPSTASNYQIQDQLVVKSILIGIMLFPLFVQALIEIALSLKPQKPKTQINQDYKIQQQPQIVKDVKKWSYNILLFPIAIGYLHYALFPSFVAKNNQQNNSYFRNNIYLIIFTRILLALFCSCVYFTESKKLFTKDQINTLQILKNDKLYQSIYLAFWFGVCLVLSIDCLYKLNWLQQFLLVLYSKFSFFWFLQQKPYRKGIDNFGQLINLIAIVLFLSFSTARKYFSIFQLEGIEIVAIFLVLFLMIVTLLITIFRTLLRLRQIYRLFAKTTGKSKQEQSHEQKESITAENILEILQSENKYRLKNMLVNKRLTNFICEESFKNRDQMRRQIFNQMKSQLFQKDNTLQQIKLSRKAIQY